MRPALAQWGKLADAVDALPDEVFEQPSRLPGLAGRRACRAPGDVCFGARALVG